MQGVTKYRVIATSWMRDAHGSSKLYEYDKENDQTIELFPEQAQYLITSGQVEPMLGETKGHPADAETGKALDLSSEERAAIQAQPDLADTTVPAENVLGSSPATNATADEAAQQDSAQEALAPPSAVEPAETKARKGRS